MDIDLSTIVIPLPVKLLFAGGLKVLFKTITHYKDKKIFDLAEFGKNLITAIVVCLWATPFLADAFSISNIPTICLIAYIMSGIGEIVFTKIGDVIIKQASSFIKIK